MSDDLVARLRHAWDERDRQYDEDERVARAAYAESPDWSIQPGHRRPRILWLDIMDSTDPATMPLVLAEHMARFAPERMLAEVERGRRDIAAKRLMVEECVYEIGKSAPRSKLNDLAWSMLLQLAEAEGVA